MNILDNLKKQIKKNYKLYIFLRNLHGLKKGISGVITGKRGSLEHIKSTISLMKRNSHISGLPMNIAIEPTNACNLQCPVCETGVGDLNRKTKYIKFDDFKIIIDKIYKHTNVLMYYFMGEPFLNKDWVKEVRYAKDKGIPFITTCTNGDLANAEDIIESKIDFVSFQLGGMSDETHKIYRVGSDFEKVIKNLEELLLLKKKKNATWLEIEVGLILMKHNEHEVEKFKNFCKEKGVDYCNVIDPCVRTVEQGHEMLPTDKDHWFYDPKSFYKGQLKPRIIPKNDCSWIYYSMVITAEGDIVPCCRDPRATLKMGNLITDSLEDIWNNEKYQGFRNAILNNQKNVDICRLCSGYGISDIA